MPLSRPSLGAGFNKTSRTQYLDLDVVRQRPAAGLNSNVRQSFAEEIISESGVGVIGWSFKQNGLNYGCRIKDENNNDVYGFGLEIPKTQPYLHRTKNMSIAEKAHILTVVEQCLPPHKREQHRSAFYELEKTCFDSSSGNIIESSIVSTKPFTPKGLVTGHAGLSFVHDIEYLDQNSSKYLAQPELTVLLLEWDSEGKLYSIDCSEGIPRFQLGYAANPNMPKINMTRAEAKDAINHARNKINMTDQDLSRLCAITGLWNRLDVISDRLSIFRQPS